MLQSPKKECDLLIRWLKSSAFDYEYWQVTAGIITSVPNPIEPHNNEAWRATFDRIIALDIPTELREVVHEYCPLMAATLTRSHSLPSKFIEDLNDIHNFVGTRLLTDSLKSSTMTEAHYIVLGRMAILNAGLSRFAAQTFSGTKRITETECHYWSHSLLGMGTATTALWRIQRFLQDKIGYARLHLRFKKFGSTKNTQNLAAETWPEGDFLGEIDMSDAENTHVRPLISYFSSRDGFRSTDLTISVPLSAVSGGNSPQWSLMTITHEVSHVIIRAILSDLYPPIHKPSDLLETIALLEAKAPGNTMLLEIRRIMLFSIHEMERVASGRKPSEAPDFEPADLHRLLIHWRIHVEETLVHTFDFLYFYGRDVERYVRGIWISWGTIPNLSTRVQGYVIRTICAIMAKHLRRGEKAADLARDELLHYLLQMQAAKQGGRYVDDAILYIKQKWAEEIRERVVARLELVKIVVHFLFSQLIATEILGEAYISAGQDKRYEGYDFRSNKLEFKPLTNPLHFLKVYTGTNLSSLAESAWIYHILAFCVETND